MAIPISSWSCSILVHDSTGLISFIFVHTYFFHTSGTSIGSTGKLGYGLNSSTVSFRHCGLCETDLATEEHNMDYISMLREVMQ